MKAKSGRDYKEEYLLLRKRARSQGAHLGNNSFKGDISARFDNTESFIK